MLCRKLHNLCSSAWFSLKTKPACIRKNTPVEVVKVGNKYKVMGESEGVTSFTLDKLVDMCRSRRCWVSRVSGELLRVFQSHWVIILLLLETISLQLYLTLPNRVENMENYLDFPWKPPVFVHPLPMYCSQFKRDLINRHRTSGDQSLWFLLPP